MVHSYILFICVSVWLHMCDLIFSLLLRKMDFVVIHFLPAFLHRDMTRRTTTNDDVDVSVAVAVTVVVFCHLFSFFFGSCWKAFVGFHRWPTMSTFAAAIDFARGGRIETSALSGSLPPLSFFTLWRWKTKIVVKERKINFHRIVVFGKNLFHAMTTIFRVKKYIYSKNVILRFSFRVGSIRPKLPSAFTIFLTKKKRLNRYHPKFFSKTKSSFLVLRQLFLKFFFNFSIFFFHSSPLPSTRRQRGMGILWSFGILGG